MVMKDCVLFWFRRDLRTHDNTGLKAALASGLPVIPLFIFDTDIIDELEPDDPRITFIYDCLNDIRSSGVPVWIARGRPLNFIKILTENYPIRAVWCNRDFEPYARKRDREISQWLTGRGITFHAVKDQVIFDRDEVLKADGKPYTVYTPYKNAWLKRFSTENPLQKRGTHTEEGAIQVETNRMPGEVFRMPDADFRMPELRQLGFQRSHIQVKPFTLASLGHYARLRDFPAQDAGSYLSVHLRFGTVSIRDVMQEAVKKDQTFMEELIWREFFMQILWHFPEVVNHNFKRAYDGVRWRNQEAEFERWCTGQTGYPLVDAGMRELNQSGYMHNRVRMISASFLCKHLLIDWRWGEGYFARKLLDFELSSNNGNWQWAAGTGCDAAPYFRVFNPEAQQKKFDPDYQYIRQWVPEYGTPAYPAPMIEHSFARQRAIEAYKSGLQKP